MKLLRQPNRWSCTVTALAMLLDESVKTLVEEIGHDGSENLFQDAPEPTNRRGFILDELIRCCWPRGYTLTPYNRVVTLCNTHTNKRQVIETSDFWDVAKSNRGLLTAHNAQGKGHMVAWDGCKIYDPNGKVVDPVDFKLNIATLYCFFRIKSI